MECPICNNEITKENIRYNDFAWNKYTLFSNLEIASCDICGFGFVKNKIDLEELGEYYSKFYRSKNSPFYFNFEKKINNRIAIDYAGDRSFAQLTLARAFAKFNPHDIFLDIGPGKGGSLLFANHLFQSPQLYCIELTKGASEFFKLNHKATTFETLDRFITKGLQAKILLMSHSLEHYRVEDLTDLLIELKSSLVNDGVIVVEVPHCDIRIHREVRGNDTPHLLFFSMESLKKLFEKNGFEILFIDTVCEFYENIELAKKRSLKRKYRGVYNKMPIELKNLLRLFVRSTIKLKSMFNKHVKLSQYTYGGNRDTLRLVARIKN